MARRSGFVRTWHPEDEIDVQILYGPTEPVQRSEPPLDAFALIEEMRMAGCSELQRRAMAAWFKCRSIATVAQMLDLKPQTVRRMLKAALGQLEAWRRRKSRKGRERS